MERFEVNILGTGSATPSARHHHSCQVVNFRDKLMMIDCGEGAQIMMRRFGLKFSRLNHIFISHLHGDHVFGLPGLIGSMALHDRGGYLVIHTFEEGRKVLEPFIRFFNRDTPFEISFNIISPGSGIIYEDRSLTVETFPLYHRVPCSGFIFREKPLQRKYLGEMGKFYNIPVHAINGIKNGNDYIMPDGTVIPNGRLTAPARKPLSYAYCSDTSMSHNVAKAIEGVDVVFHEATYDDSFGVMAADRGHATASQAARIALEAGAGCLVIGHYSKRYKDEQLLVEQARKIFPNTIGAMEGMTIPLNNPLNYAML